MAEIIIAGFGGQGVLLLGQLIAYGGMVEEKEVSWFPAYGPEQRGGTCNCSVVVSEKEIGSPVVSRPTSVIAMNNPSLERFGNTIVSGGILVYNSSLIEKKPLRCDIKVIAVPANKIASELGSSRVANMVLLGAFIEATGIVKTSSIEESLKTVISERNHHLIPLNMQALKRGRAYQ